MEADPALVQSVDSLAVHYVPSASGGQVPLVGDPPKSTWKPGRFS